VATWNVHGFVGASGRRETERIAETLRRLDADVIALQEVDAGPQAEDTFETLGPELGFGAIAGPTLERSDGRYGNLLLTRHPVRRADQIDLSQPGAEPRGAIDVSLVVEGATVRVLATHLGLTRRERARQARRLADALDADADAHPVLTLLLGDLNEWRRPLTRTGLGPLARRFARRSRHRTFPARAPLLALDRVLVSPRAARMRTRVASDPATRVLSDHLLLHARIALEAAG
jgi:endonuclease/exonuclease/phosphatase family metal-dependent hydrolase